MSGFQNNRQWLHAAMSVLGKYVDGKPITKREGRLVLEALVLLGPLPEAVVVRYKDEGGSGGN